MENFPLTSEDQHQMLAEIGVQHFGEMLKCIPEKLRNPKINLPEALSELDAQKWFCELAGQNITLKQNLSFLGSGCYEHFIPSIVRHVVSRSEFYTAYTPYQPEASQGSLQMLFEYQSLMCELTGLEVSNGSHYDGATALAESLMMALNHTRRNNILIASSVHPEYRLVARTYLQGTHGVLEEVSFSPDFAFDLNDFKKKLSPEIAAVVIQSPNFFGLVEDLTEIEKLVHANGSLLIMMGHPLSFGFFKSPGEWHADIACGEGQPLGIVPGFGGPWLGYLVTTKALMRRIPGRLVGMTKDHEGRRAFCLTLQAREQHIRREKAQSNICSNQALCAMMACVYLATLGESGVKQMAELNLENANYLRDSLGAVPGIEVLTKGTIFNEFVVKFSKPIQKINGELRKRGMIGGLDLERFYPTLKNQTVFCATETKSKAEMDRFVSELKRISQ